MHRNDEQYDSDKSHDSDQDKNPRKIEEKLGSVTLEPLAAAEMTENIDKKKNTVAITAITGIIISIQLAVRPSFLPDSSDTLNPPIMLLSQVSRNKLFVRAQPSISDREQ